MSEEVGLVDTVHPKLIFAIVGVGCLIEFMELDGLSDELLRGSRVSKLLL